MRMILLLAAACLLVTGCATSAHPISNVERVRGMYDAFARGDGPAVLAALSPEVVWMEAENQGLDDRNPYRGPAAVGEGVFGRLLAAYPDFQVLPETFIDGGDRVVVLGRYRGTSQRTNRTLDAQFAHVWTLANGQVTDFQQYTDTAQWQRVAAP